MNGIVKKKNDRGFGFITPDGETTDVFFHSSALEGVTFEALQEGAHVTFNLEQGERGPSAKNVKLVE